MPFHHAVLAPHYKHMLHTVLHMHWMSVVRVTS